MTNWRRWIGSQVFRPCGTFTDRTGCHSGSYFPISNGSWFKYDLLTEYSEGIKINVPLFKDILPKAIQDRTESERV